MIHLQAVDLWNNNLTRGGDQFVARWTPQHDEFDPVGVEEGEHADTDPSSASIAAGFSFHVTASTNKSNDGFNGSEEFDGGYGFASANGSTGAFVTDMGTGRYEVATETVAGSHWLEIGVIEPGGLWGTYYEDGGVDTDGERRYTHGYSFCSAPMRFGRCVYEERCGGYCCRVSSSFRVDCLIRGIAAKK